MLLNHTSGLDTQGRGAATAVHAPLMLPVGSAFAYNNPAVDLLAEIIEKASGQPAERYIARRLFEPLGISDWNWDKDSEGYPLAAGDLELRPLDLAKIGQMLLDGGKWKGRQIVNPKWLAESTRPSQPYFLGYGLLWWLDDAGSQVGLTPRLLEAWIRAGVRPGLVDPLIPLVGRPMKSGFWQALKKVYADRPGDLEELQKALDDRRLNPIEILELGPVEGYSARGWLGQFLVIDPARGLVGVRFHIKKGESQQWPVNTFDDFPELIHQLAPRSE
jgi:CubicO group peptidase (beta-lactamase class C family)